MSRTRKKSRRKLDTIANSVATVSNLATGQTLVYGNNSWTNGYPQGFGTYPIDITGIQPGQTLVWNGIRWVPSTAAITVTGRSYLGANPYLASITGGDQVRLTGTGLEAVQSVVIDNNVVSVFAATPTALTITTPALASGFHVIYLVTAVNTYRVAQSLAAGTTIVLVVGTPDITLNSASAYSNNLTITGGVGAVAISLSGTLASFLTYLNGTVSGTLPRVSQDMSYSYTITATDGVQTVSSIATVTVKFIPILWVTPAGNIRTVSDAARTGFSFTLSATYRSSPITVFGLTSGGLPSGLSLNTTTGVISGDIAGSISNTVFSFTVTAFTSDGFTSNARVFSITVNAAIVDTALPYVSQLLKTAPVLTSSTTVVDSAATPNTITRTNAPTTGLPSPYQTDGYWSNYFDGSSWFEAAMPGSGGFTFPGDFTIECWVYLTSNASGYAGIIDTRYSTSGTTAWFFNVRLISGINRIQFTASDVIALVGTSRVIDYNTWTHLAVVRAGSLITGYVNGVADSTTYSTSSTLTPQSVSNFQIGRMFNASLLFNGYISNLRVVKGVAVYTGNFAVPTSPLTTTQSSSTNIAAITGTATSLLTCQSNRFIDNSANNFTLTRNGSPSVQSNYYPFAAIADSPGAALFNGTTAYLTTPSNTVFTLGTNNHTIEFWIYQTARSQYDTPWNYGGNSTFATNRYYLNFGTTIALLLGNGGGGWGVNIQPSAPALNAWHHVAIVRNGNVFTLYIDGVSTGTSTYSGSISAQSVVMTIGADTGGSAPVTGYISNFRFVNGTAVYTGNFAPPTNFLQTSGAASAASYTSTTNVNTTFPAANTSLLLNLADSNYAITTNSATNNTFIDGSANAFPITRTGSPTQGSLTPYWPNGYWSNYFDGSNSYIRTTGVSFTSPSFTIECWFYFTGSAANQSIYDFSAGIGTYGVYTAIGGSNISTQFYSTNASGSLIGIISTPYANYLNQWVHLAVTFDGSTYRMYLNGVSVGTPVSSTTQIVTLTVLTAGGRSDSTQVAGYGWVGYVSNLRYVRGTVVYTGNFIPPTSPLQKTQFGNGGTTQAITGTQTAFLTCQSYRFLDNSANNFAITTNGTPQVQTFDPFLLSTSYSPTVYGGSGYFNGSTDYLTYIQTFALGTNNFTIEFWMYVPVNPVYPTNYWLWGWRNNTDNCPGMYLNAVSGGGNTLWFTGNLGFISNPSSIPTSSWNHIAIVRYGLGTNNLKMYVNGVQVAQVTNTQNFTYTGTQPVGANPSGNGGLYPANVYFSNFRIVNGIAVYTGAFTPPTLAPLKTAGATSAASYSNTTNVNTGFLAANTGLLLNFANAAIYDATAQNNLVTAGSAQISTAITPQWGTTSMRFNGSTDYLLFPANPSFALGTGDFTIEVWVYPMSSTGTQGIMGIGVGGTTGDLQFFYNFVGNTNKVTLNCTNGTTATSTASVPLNQWAYVAFSRTAGSLRLFINGTLDRTLAYADNFNKNVVSVGRSYSNLNQEYFNGYIQDFRITRGVARTITASPTDEFPTIAVNPLIVSGQTAYTTAGTYFWTAPANVTSVCVVCVGGGGSGGTDWSSTRSSTGGGGGALAWGNDIPVVPGVSYTVVVGDGGAGFTGSINSNGNPGGISYFISDTYLAAGGGGAGIHKGAGSSSGGAPVISASITSGGGGAGGGSTQPTGTFRGVGGGGAGGYSGNGGSASWGSNGTAAAAGSGGGGGGGSTSTSGGGGGGVGILGQGTDGIGGTGTGGGSGGSSGSSGTAGVQNGGGTGSPGVYGGGSGGHAKNGNPTGEWSVAGGSGAVRIIWGPGRSFPNNAANV
jgi:hypothetical protein